MDSETGTISGAFEDQLKALLASSDPATRGSIVGLMKRAVSVSLDGTVNEVDLIHSMLRNVGMGFSVPPPTTKRVPPVYKVYDHAVQIPLPTEFVSMEYSLEQVIRARAARRDYVDRTVSLDALSTFLHWSCGIRRYGQAYNSGAFPIRFTPSGGGLQPWEVYVIVNNVEQLAQGLYHYRAQSHALELLQEGQMRGRMVELGFGVEFLHYASFICIVTCVPDRFFWKYGTRGYRTAHIDVGVLVQSMWYVATALKLRSLPVSGFSDDGVDEFLALDGQREFSMILFVVGARPDTAVIQ